MPGARKDYKKWYKNRYGETPKGAKLPNSYINSKWQTVKQWRKGKKGATKGATPGNNWQARQNEIPEVIETTTGYSRPEQQWGGPSRPENGRTTGGYSNYSGSTVSSTAINLQAEINEIRMKLNELLTRERPIHSCRAYNDAAISHDDTGNWHVVALNSESYDTDGLHDTSTNNSRITCLLAGYYVIIGQIEFQENDTGIRAAGIKLNGLTYIAITHQNNVGASLHTSVQVATLYHLAVNDYVELYGYQNSGGNLNMEATSAYSPYLMVGRL